MTKVTPTKNDLVMPRKWEEQTRDTTQRRRGWYSAVELPDGTRLQFHIWNRPGGRWYGARFAVLPYTEPNVTWWLVPPGTDAGPAPFEALNVAKHACFCMATYLFGLPMETIPAGVMRADYSRLVKIAIESAAAQQGPQASETPLSFFDRTAVLRATADGKIGGADHDLQPAVPQQPPEKTKFFRAVQFAAARYGVRTAHILCTFIEQPADIAQVNGIQYHGRFGRVGVKHLLPYMVGKWSKNAIGEKEGERGEERLPQLTVADLPHASEPLEAAARAAALYFELRQAERDRISSVYPPDPHTATMEAALMNALREALPDHPADKSKHPYD